ncbi:hypothetical protein ACEWY4_022832 [Coilia grayii]|uniref:C-type lectin domain-containing protein n=1 Tax=Coilia grayii TaxID=363190 RepID=A0ABD1J2A0_9TELE
MDDAIYVNSEDLNLQEMSSAKPRTQTSIWAKTGPPPPPSGAADRCCRWTAVCLGLLCALLLGLFIGLAAWLLTERHQLLTNNTNLLKERDQLLTNHTNLLKERYELLTNYSNLIKERDHFNLTEKPRCPRGWKFFECNCYHNKHDYRSWSDSRRYCQSLGGDLVLIKTPEKQRFITEMGYGGWIGLRKGEKNRSWGWLDDTPVCTWYWHPGKSNTTSGNCVAIHHSNTSTNTWYDYTCDRAQYSICEVPAFNIQI